MAKISTLEDSLKLAQEVNDQLKQDKSDLLEF